MNDSVLHLSLFVSFLFLPLLLFIIIEEYKYFVQTDTLVCVFLSLLFTYLLTHLLFLSQEINKHIKKNNAVHCNAMQSSPVQCSQVDILLEFHLVH